MKYLVLLSFSILSMASCQVAKVLSDATPPSHELWHSLLQKHVDTEGWVDYQHFQEDSVLLNAYLETLEAGHPNDRHWTNDEQLAYWINAYNAYTVKLIVDHYPLESIKDIKKGIPFVNTVWDIKFIEIEGHTYDLNNIEHGIIRKQFDEPRIHFAVNCASVSCPRLSNRAFTAQDLDQQLTKAARGFLADPIRNQTADGLLSPIFSWFKGDFTKSGSLRDFINQYAAEKIPEDTKIKFLDYDWTINGTSNRMP